MNSSYIQNPHTIRVKIYFSELTGCKDGIGFVNEDTNDVYCLHESKSPNTDIKCSSGT